MSANVAQLVEHTHGGAPFPAQFDSNIDLNLE